MCVMEMGEAAGAGARGGEGVKPELANTIYSKGRAGGGEGRQGKREGEDRVGPGELAVEPMGMARWGWAGIEEHRAGPRHQGANEGERKPRLGAGVGRRSSPVRRTQPPTSRARGKGRGAEGKMGLGTLGPWAEAGHEGLGRESEALGGPT